MAFVKLLSMGYNFGDKMKIYNIVLNDFRFDNRVLYTSLSLSRFGHDVTVLAIGDHLSNGRSTHRGVKVNRIDLSNIKIDFFYLSLILKVVKFILICRKLSKDADVYHCNDLYGLVVGISLKLTNRKAKVVYDSHEFSPNDIPNQSRLSQFTRYCIEYFFIKFAVDVITVSGSISKEYSRLYNIREPIVMYNCPPMYLGKKSDYFRECFNIAKESRIFIYQGKLVEGRGIATLLSVFSELDDKNCIVFLGYGPMERDIRIAASRFKNVFYHDAVSGEDLLYYTSAADFGLCPTEPTCLSEEYSLPNKFFEYLSVGVPVISSNLEEMKNFIDEYKIGYVVEKNDHDSFKRAILDVDNWCNNEIYDNIAAIRGLCSWEAQEVKLRSVYEKWM